MKHVESIQDLIEFYKTFPDSWKIYFVKNVYLRRRNELLSRLDERFGDCLFYRELRLYISDNMTKDIFVIYNRRGVRSYPPLSPMGYLYDVNCERGDLCNDEVIDKIFNNILRCYDPDLHVIVAAYDRWYPGSWLGEDVFDWS